MTKPNNIQPFLEQLNLIAADIQQSPELQNYREEETDEAYKALADEFEPRMMEIHKEVNNHYPLEIEAFEYERTI